MQRIPNPVSDPAIFIRTFREMHEVLKDHASFTLDDMTQAMIDRNNVTSQGAIGEEALRRSTRKDRSRDPLYNQSKMYAELFRTLGWIHFTTSKLTFAFSFLGEHIATAIDPNPLMQECLLGIAYPNEVLGVQTEQKLRVIGTILLVMDTLGSITRDELMGGPMSILDDTKPKDFASMVGTLTKCRKKRGALNRIIERIAARRGITRKPTMENYTRFPIAVFPWAGWAIKPKGGLLVITNDGRAMAARLREGTDIRLEDFEKFTDRFKPAFVRWTFYKMLERAGFETAPVAEQMKKDEALLARHRLPCRGDVYFSPFQQLSRETITNLCPDLVATKESEAAQVSESLLATFGGATVSKRPHEVLAYQVSTTPVTMTTATQALVQEIRVAYKRHKSDVARTVEALAQKYDAANQDVFYPLVANLFRLLGFDCQPSRRGVNYARADAMILDKLDSIPIEIKSPGEEMEISVKGVRQAIENKVVLLSRKSYNTRADTTSLVVGYNAPNDRSEVHELIDDFARAFGMHVGVIDFRSLLTLCVQTVATGKKLKFANFRTLQGAIRV